MGPRARYLRSGGSCRRAHLARPIPAVNHKLIDETDIAPSAQDPGVGAVRLATGVDRLGVGVHLPGSDKRGGAKRRAHSALRRRRRGKSTSPSSWRRALKTLEEHPEAEFNRRSPAGKKVSVADLIVSGGCAGVEQGGRRMPVTP